MVTKVWEHPDIFSIQVDLPDNPLRNLNAYVLMDQGENLIIDTGFNRPECRKDLWAGIEELGLDLSRTSLFLTHLHSDHVGLACDFEERGCPIYMGRIDYEFMTGMKTGKNGSAMETLFQEEGFPPEELARQGRENQARRYGVNRVFHAAPLEDGAVLTIGGVELQCIHTPGHTPGHMVLYLPKEQLLFSGDHILFDITPNIAVWYRVPHSLDDYLASLSKIRALPIRAAFPAHRHGPGEGGISPRIDALIQHHTERLAELFQAVAGHPDATAFQIAGMLTWSAHGLGWAQFPPHQKWFAMGETLAHLRWLEDHGLVSRTQRNGLFHYHISKEKMD